MKKLFLVFTLSLLGHWASAQSASNVVVTSILQLSNGQAFTNSMNSKSTNVFAAATNSMVNLNQKRAVENKTAVTNLGQFIIEFTKEAFQHSTEQFNMKLAEDMIAKQSLMTQADLDAIRAIVNKY